METWEILYLNLHPVVTACHVPGWSSTDTERRQQDESGRDGLQEERELSLHQDGVWATKRYSALTDI